MAVRKYWTWSQVKEHIKNTLDLNEETFVRPAELLEYCNAAIEEAEGEIHALNQDYFKKRATLTLTAGQDFVAAPEDLFGMMVRELVFDDGTRFYRVKRLVGENILMRALAKNRNSGNSDHEWYILNQGPNDLRIYLTPNIRDSGPLLTAEYIRSANRVENDTDYVDLPECYNFLFQKIKCLVYEKEGHPNADTANVVLEAMRANMQGLLANAIPDGDNFIEPDLTHYYESEG